MKPRIKLDAVTTASGAKIELIQHDQDFLLAVNQEVLMSTRVTLSEEILAETAIARCRDHERILIGGLGLGFTLRRILELTSKTALITQVELIAKIVEWNRGPLAEANAHSFDDPRLSVKIDNVAAAIRAKVNYYDAIVLDVDNGPSAMVSPDNESLYSTDGVKQAFRALRANGRFTIWSADDDEAFKRRLRRSGFQVSTQVAKGSRGKGGPRHVIFVADK